MKPNASLSTTALLLALTGLPLALACPAHGDELITNGGYAVSDSLGPGTHLLLQSFIIPTHATDARISFDMFVNDWNGAGALNQNGPLDRNQLDGSSNLIPTQFASGDLLRGGADAFSVAPGDVVENLFLGEDAGTPANDYTHYSFDVSSLTSGATYQLRFAEVDNQFTINQGVDNVSVMSAPTPEPGTLGLLLGMGITGTTVLRRRLRHRRALRVRF